MTVGSKLHCQKWPCSSAQCMSLVGILEPPPQKWAVPSSLLASHGSMDKHVQGAYMGGTGWGLKEWGSV